MNLDPFEIVKPAESIAQITCSAHGYSEPWERNLVALGHLSLSDHPSLICAKGVILAQTDSLAHANIKYA